MGLFRKSKVEEDKKTGVVDFSNLPTNPPSPVQGVKENVVIDTTRKEEIKMVEKKIIEMDEELLKTEECCKKYVFFEFCVDNKVQIEDLTQFYLDFGKAYGLDKVIDFRISDHDGQDS